MSQGLEHRDARVRSALSGLTTERFTVQGSEKTVPFGTPKDSCLSRATQPTTDKFPSKPFTRTTAFEFPV